MPEMNTQDLRISFGGYKGELWSRVPLRYLYEVVHGPPINGNAKDIARAELRRRGAMMPTIEVSPQAIDSASLYCRKDWRRTALDASEGLHAWLFRIATDTLVAQPPRDNEGPEGMRGWNGLKFVFAFGQTHPTLMNIMPTDKKDKPKLKPQVSLPF